MGLSLSTDLIADVMRNTDPARLQTATAKLRALDPSGSQGPVFAGVLNELSTGSQEARTSEAQVGFEQMVLRNLFESLLPGAESGAFGSGPSAGVWRSMAADKLAGLYADSGGIGIAGMLSAKNKEEQPPAEGQWPYFTTGQITTYSG